VRKENRCEHSGGEDTAAGDRQEKQGPKRCKTREEKITQKTTPVPCIKTGGRKVSVRKGKGTYRREEEGIT
jgi:hypothetical protein